LLLPAAAGFAALGALGISSVGATWLLIPVAATFALGGAGMAPMMDVRILEMVGADRTRYARVRVWASVSFIIATPLVGLLIDRDGLHALFWVMIPALLGTGLAASTLPGRKVTVRAPSMTRAVGTVLRHRPIALFLIGATVAWTAPRTRSSPSTCCSSAPRAIRSAGHGPSRP
jgi:MFS family permease